MKFAGASCVAAFVAAASVAKADYVSTTLLDLVGTADIAAAGEIVEVHQDTFVLKVDETLIGEKHETIEIQQFRDWACASRWAPYKVGQKVLVFLEEKDGEFTLPGAGGESESPIEGKFVYCQFPYPADPLDLERYGAHHAPKLRLHDLMGAIREYRSCFRVTPAKDPWRRVGEHKEYFAFDRIEQVCSTLALRKYTTHSAVHTYLVESTRRERERLKPAAHPEQLPRARYAWPAPRR